MTDRLLDELAGDCWERLRWVVCRRAGILPGSLTWRLMTRRRTLLLACHLALDAREPGAGRLDAAQGAERGVSGGFDMERFQRLGGGGS